MTHRSRAAPDDVTPRPAPGISLNAVKRGFGRQAILDRKTGLQKDEQSKALMPLALVSASSENKGVSRRGYPRPFSKAEGIRR
jgi:hypothetical protein